MQQLTSFQPTLPARGATGLAQNIKPEQLISTHAPRTGSDTLRKRDWLKTKAFQPTLPARGATSTSVATRISTQIFQPTLPARGATRW